MFRCRMPAMQRLQQGLKHNLVQCACELGTMCDQAGATAAATDVRLAVYISYCSVAYTSVSI